MRLTAINLQNVKSVGVYGREVRLGPVTVLAGPNGAGKTAVVGAIAYALTGQFLPRVGADQASLLGLANDPAAGLRVTLLGKSESHAGEQMLSVDRAVRPGGHELVVTLDKEGSVRGKAAESVLTGQVGDAAAVLDALDPVRGIWLASDEKRKAWLSAATRAVAPAWPLERLTAIVGVPSDDWNPTLTESIPTTLAIHLERVHRSLLDAQKVVRQSEQAAAQMAVPPVVPTWDEVEAGSGACSALSDKVEACKQRLSDVDNELGAGPPPALIDEAKAEELLLAAQIAETDAEQAFNNASRLVVPQHALADWMSAAVLHAEEDGGRCPACGTENVAQAVRDGAERVRVVYEKIAGAAEKAEAALGRAREATRCASAVYAGAIRGRLAAELTAAQAEYDQAVGQWDRLRAEAAVARERASLLDAASNGAARVEQLKALFGRLRDARDRLLEEAAQPLRTALGDLAALAPAGRAFAVQFPEGELRWGLTDKDGRFVGYEALSGAERLRLAIGMTLAAYRLATPQPPWRAIVIDGIEAVYPESTRCVLIKELGAACRRGELDNVIIAGAMDAPPVGADVVVHEFTEAT